MARLELQFVGSGDAFGSGGRFNTCIMASCGGSRFLVDCGASSLVALRSEGIDPNQLGLILITHLHGDHFGGLPFLLMDAKHLSHRRQPLILAGPPGLETRLRETREALFPGSTTAAPAFPLHIREIHPGTPLTMEITPARGIPPETVSVEAFAVDHPSGAPAYAYHIQAGGRSFAHSGDTGWCPGLVDAARGAHLLITECCSYARELKHHLNYQTLQAHRAELETPRIILTHMNPDMLEHSIRLPDEFARDGLVVQV